MSEFWPPKGFGVFFVETVLVDEFSKFAQEVESIACQSYFDLSVCVSF
jgi:hypothetical protein